MYYTNKILCLSSSGLKALQIVVLSFEYSHDFFPFLLKQSA